MANEINMKYALKDLVGLGGLQGRNGKAHRVSGGMKATFLGFLARE